MTEENQQPTVKPFAAKLFNHDTGQWEETPSDEVDQKLSAGTHTFETGIRVPMVSPRGNIINVASDRAYEATTKGFRWMTPDAQTAAHDKASKAAVADQARDQPLTAIIAGAARTASLGLSDVALEAGGLGEATKAVKEENPVASFAGEAAGMLAPVGPVAAGIRGAKAAGVATKAALQGSSKVAQTIVPKVVQGAVEGAYFGLGQGISEAALGDPEDVVDHLIGNVGAGVLFGGAAGGIFGTATAARPYFDKLVEKGTTGFKSIVDKTVHKTGLTAIKASLNKKGLNAVAAELGEQGLSKELAQEIAEAGGVEAYKKNLQQLRPEIEEAKLFQRTVQADVKRAVKDLREEAQTAVAQAIDTAGGNVYKAAQVADDAYKTIRSNFDLILPSQQGPATGAVNDAVTDAVKRLERTKSVQAKSFASRISGRQRVADLTTEGAEASYLVSLADDLRGASRKGLSDADKSVVDGLLGKIDDTLETHPNKLISESYQAIRHYGDARKQLRSVVDKTLTRTIGDDTAYSSSKALKTLMDPEKRQAIEATFANLEQLAPEFKVYSQGLTTAKDKIALREAIEQKLKGGVRGEDVLEIFDLLGKAPNDLSAKLAQVREINAALAEGSMIDRAIGIKKALGQPIGEDLQRLAQAEKKFRIVDMLSGVDAVGYSAQKGVMGSVAGSLFGPGVGKVVGALAGIQKTNLGKYVEVMGQVYKATQAGQQAIEKGVKGAAKALTSDKAFRATMTIGNTVDKGPTIKERRKTFKDLKKQLPQMAAGGQQVDGRFTPQIAQALQGRQQQIAKFLQKKMPADPFEETALSLFDTGYEPPDQELAKFYRYVKAVENPMSVLKSIKEGSVSIEEVETLREMYPKIYDSLQTTVLDGIIERGPDLSYQQKIQLGILFDIPTAYSLQPDFIARMQAGIHKDEGGRPEGTGGNKRIQIDLKPEETIATATSRLS